MRLFFVRHGEPNYRDDCVTSVGQIQAEACSVRLLNEGLTKIYASPMGRARQTASCTAKKLGLPVEILDYMHELDWRSKSGDELPYGGHPWELGSMMIRDMDWNFKDDNWREQSFYADNLALDRIERIEENIDGLLSQYGYERRGTRYFCNFTTNETPAVFSHGGSSGAAISHIINMPFPYFVSVFEYWFTSVTILEFPDTPGEFVYPRVRLFNDCAHTNKKVDDKVEYKL